MSDNAPHQKPLDEKALRYQVLARKYRPSSLSELIGQDAMVRTLNNGFQKNRLAHAFMLTGVRGVGKTSTARIIARSINCIGLNNRGGPTVNPCGKCPNCISITADRHVDVMEMDAASRTGIDDIRELIEGTGYRPISAPYKIYIIDEVHMLSKNAFNALLKTLEEPPEHVKFIFATTEIRKVPVTILSRCQRFDLRRVSNDILVKHLESICKKEGAKAANSALQLIARSAAGSVRDALSLLDQAISYSEDKITEIQVQQMLGLADRSLVFEIVETIFLGNISRTLEIFEHQYRNGADPINIIEDILTIIHWLTKIKIVPSMVDSKETLENERSFGLKLSKSLHMSELTRVWQMLLKGLKELNDAPLNLHVAEMILIRVAYASELPTPEEALKHFSESRDNSTTKKNSTINLDKLEDPTSKKKILVDKFQPKTAAKNSSVLSSNESSILKTFEDVITLTEKLREGRLTYFLVHQARVISYTPGLLVLNQNIKDEKLCIQELKYFLENRTASPWVIRLETEPGDETIYTQRTIAEEQHRIKSLQDPLVQAIIKTFPKASVSKVQKTRS